MFRRLVSTLGAVVLTLLFFLVLPLIQTLAEKQRNDVVLASVDAGAIEAPDPVEEPEPEDEPEPEEEPPELVEEFEPLDLSQLEAAMSASLGEGGLAFEFDLDSIAGSAGGAADMIAASGGGPEKRPSVVYRPPLRVDDRARKRVPGAVRLRFIVNTRGRVENPIVESSTDPVFERSALNAIKQWRYEPGRRGGQPSPFHVKQTITFPKELER